MVKKIADFIKSKYFFIFGSVFALAILINNVFYYPVNAGYDAALHLRYADIISRDFRLPEMSETREGYNPPLFYLASGLIIKGFSQITGQDFFTAAKIWQYAGIILIFLSLFFWYKIIKTIYPKDNLPPRIFLLFFFLLPVFHKTVVMYNLEVWFLFLSSVTLWFFITRFLTKPNLINIIILSMLLSAVMLTRMNGIVLVLTAFVGIIGMLYQKKIKFKKFILFIGLLFLIIFISTAWFYIGRKDKDIYGVGEGEKLTTPFFQRQPLSFYIDVPFKLMMTYPIRQSVYINKLIPIYYDEMWGDYWNYFPQRRFGITIQQVKQNREYTNSARVSSLALQNRINLLPTVMMLLGLLLVSARFVLNFKKNDKRWLIEGMFLCLTALTWIGFLVLLTQFPSWKGDSIKASYMLYNLPIFIYFLTVFLFDIVKKHKVIFIPVAIYLILASGINLWWCWY